LLKKLNFRNPTWRTAAILKIVKSQYLCNRLTDFDEIRNSDAYSHITADRPFKILIFKNPRWRQRSSWKSQKSRYLHNSLTNLYEIWYADAKWVPTVKKSNFKKSKTTDGRHFENRKIAISLQPCDRFW